MAEDIKEIEEEQSQPFSGWEDPDDIDFFGEESPTKKETVILEEEEETPKGKKSEEDEEEEDKTSKAKKEEDDVKNSLFTGEDEEDDDSSEDEKPEDKKKKETKQEGKASPKTHLEYLKEKGLVDFELEEGEELTDEKAEELLEDSFDSSVESRVEELFSEMPQVVKDIVKFAKNGGDVGTLLQQMTPASSGISSDLDLSKESNQEKVIRHQLKEDGYDKDIIDSQVEFFKESGKLEGTAKKFFERITKKNQEAQKTLLQQQEERAKAQKEARREYKKKVSDSISKATEINGLKLSRKDKSDLPAYISDQSIKLENGNTISPLQKDIFEALRDEKKTIMLAKILKSDFDFSDLTKEATSKKAKEIKNELEHTETKTPRSKGGSAKRQRSLEDYF